MDKFSDLQAFVTVVDSGTFSSAAERLDVAKSAVSRRISSLENRLGSRLLNRTTRRLSLTEAGKVFYQQSRQILLDLDEAEQQVSEQQSSLKGLIRIATPLSFGYLQMAPLLNEFLQRHPDIELEVNLNDRYINLVEQGYDLAIRIGELQDSNLVARRITDINLVTVASEAYIKRKGEPKTPEDLERHETLEYDNVPRGQRWRYQDEQGKALLPNVKARVKANNGSLLMAMAEAGQGILRSPLFICADALRSGAVKQVLADWEESPVSMYVVYPPGRLQSRRVREFTDFVVETFRSNSHWEAGDT